MQKKVVHLRSPPSSPHPPSLIHLLPSSIISTRKREYHNHVNNSLTATLPYDYYHRRRHHPALLPNSDLENTAEICVDIASTKKSFSDQRSFPPPASESILRSLLGWVYPIAYRGYKRPLNENDIPNLLSFHRSAERVKDGLSYVSRQKQRGQRVSTYGICWAIGTFPLVLGCVFSVLQGVVSTAARAFVLRVVVSTLTDDTATEADAYSSTVLFILVVLFEGLLGQLARYFIAADFTNVFVAALSSMLVKKSLTVAAVTSGGQESSLLGNDILRTAENIRMFAQFPGSIAGVISGGTNIAS